MADKKRVLLISYAFPPTGGAGVQRATKFVKYLPHYGWQPSVLTVSNPSVPVHDEHLFNEIPAATTMVRARTWEPNYRWKRRVADRNSGRRNWRWLLRRVATGCLQPDPQILWNVPAYYAGRRLLRATSHAAILVTGPPFSSFLLGCKLKKKIGLPLIVDFRDEWALVSRHLENHRTGQWAAWFQGRMRRQVLRQADAVVATTIRSARELQQECVQAGSNAQVSCIYNGFDRDDLPTAASDDPEPDRSRCLKLVYTGTLWNLTDIGPLIKALSQLELGAAIELHVAGRRTDSQAALLSQLQETGVKLTTYDYLPHQAALQLASSADVLLLTLSDAPGADRVVPAKLFEYMALQKQILAIVPEGETRELLANYPAASMFSPRETTHIAHWLTEALGRHHSAKSLIAVPPALLDRYSRSAQAEQLSRILDGV